MQIGMLGPFDVRGDGGVAVEVPGARLRGLLVALALRPGRVVPKAALVDWIWGDQPPADAVNALQRLASRLRKVLPDGVVEGRPEGYRLRVEPEAVDAVRFEQLLAAARTGSGVQDLRDALALWRGAALQDVDLPDSEALHAAATRLEGLRLTAFEDRYDAEVRLGYGADVVGELTDLVADHPVRERLVAALMRALVATGRDTDALLVYERTRQTLADELGADPSPELSAVHVALLRGELGRPEDSRRTNVRAELTSFVGRETDVAAVRELVGGHRLTTLIGPGGSGKTRLATETARTLLAGVPDGVWLAELAPIGPDGDLAQAVLGVLRLRDPLLGDGPDAEPIERLVAACRERSMLLVLDNCEHVIEAAAAFAYRMLGECPQLRVLATSREPLGITGEALWAVAPLDLPADDADPSGIEQAPAVRLLADRAVAVRAGLGNDAATLATMARICRALDGIPLAVELAAARLRTMTLDQLADRLDDRFRLLTGGSRTALARHRTLRAVIDWSWELLTDRERVVLRRLSVFAGGAGLEAAERVCADGEEDREQVLDLLIALTEKSLVVTGDGRAPRYRMLGMIREYAELRLAEAGESESARRTHLAYFTELAETAEPHLRRADQLTWLGLVEAEHDNLGAAMRGAVAVGETEPAMRLAAAAAWYWWLAGHKSEGQELTLAAVAVPSRTPGEVPDATRAVVYGFVSMFLTSGQGDVLPVADWIHQAYELSRQPARGGHPALAFAAPLESLIRRPDDPLGAFEPLLDHEDPWVRALARLQLGKMRILLGEGGHEADDYLRAALTEFRAIGERWGISFALSELANRVAARGDFTTACAYYDQAVATVLEVGAVEDVIGLRSRQAQVLWLAGDEPASAVAMAEAQRYADQVAWPNALAELALAKAELARWRDDPAEARRQLDRAVALMGEDADQANVQAIAHDLRGYLTDDLAEARKHRAAAYRAATAAAYAPVTAPALVGLADLALRLGRDEQAAELLAASTTVRGLPDHSRPDTARIERTLRTHLGDHRYTELTQPPTPEAWHRTAESVLTPDET